MTNNHSAIAKQTKQFQLLVCIYVDHQNVHLTQYLASQLLEFVKSQGHLIDVKVYYNSLDPAQVFAKDKLASFGFKWIDVPCPLKNSADNQSMVDCLEDIHSDRSPDIVILVSGDGDFVKLVLTAQKLGKKIIAFAQRGNVKQRLKEVVGSDFHFLDELPSLIGFKTQPQIENSQCQLTYNEAVEYLIEAIKTALSKRKRAGLGFINSLMCQLFPKYQGVNSVCKHQGKTFSRFSELVETAVKDGKIRFQDNQLFVIEADKVSA
ncbi:NYN domain-containing protein [Microcoleus sp. bin38.metabat.b11b12b14.051]|uniref:NYN domain-containing protein n=1 Tax=Microcoleus sp. bin38.metabat.b11b12b14.051 TaxID=2742709 RepID=UPI0025E3B1B1|nr:NYN domain-containing protein [Microcoleus sp. bin38.metabat.b11b12b14.051]